MYYFFFQKFHNLVLKYLVDIEIIGSDCGL